MRTRRAKDFGYDFITFIGTREEISNLISYSLNIDSDPNTYQEELKSQDTAFWKEAINDKIDSIMGNNTWKLVGLPYGYKAIGCKWFFENNMNVDGTIEKLKAKLVAKVFTPK